MPVADQLRELSVGTLDRLGQDRRFATTPHMPDGQSHEIGFSLGLNEDQLRIQERVHGFAEGVIRPAAHEWDEREETPWPIIEEAASMGLYSLDFVANAFTDPSGVLTPRSA